MIEDGLEKEKEKITAANQYTAVTDPFFDNLVESKNIKKLVSEKEVKEAFLRPPIDSRGQLRVSIAKHLEGKLDTLSWSYLKIKKGRKVLPYAFEDLEGWTNEKINQVIKDVEAL